MLHRSRTIMLDRRMEKTGKRWFMKPKVEKFEERNCPTHLCPARE